MKRFLCVILILAATLLPVGCSKQDSKPQVVATTLPVYEFTTLLCEGTAISVSRLITDDISCLHDYSLQVSQMRAIEASELVVISGAGLEEFLYDLFDSKLIIDSSKNIELHHLGHSDHHDAHHASDPHIWLSVENAKLMAQNICDGLAAAYPQYKDLFNNNLSDLIEKLEQLQAYGNNQLSNLHCRKIITFHEGFSYFADAFSLEILYAIEEEFGSEASANELKNIVQIINSNSLPAIFTEKNGSTSAADIISAETGVDAFTLDMAISGESYFTAMYNNIETIKEALG